MSEFEVRKNAIKNTDAAERREWATPTVRRMRAGDAENAYTNTREDGIYTKS